MPMFLPCLCEKMQQTSRECVKMCVFLQRLLIYIYPISATAQQWVKTPRAFLILRSACRNFRSACRKFCKHCRFSLTRVAYFHYEEQNKRAHPQMHPLIDKIFSPLQITAYVKTQFPAGSISECATRRSFSQPGKGFLLPCCPYIPH